MNLGFARRKRSCARCGQIGTGRTIELAITGASLDRPRTTHSEHDPSGARCLLPKSLEQMGGPIDYPTRQRYEHDKAQEGNTFVIPESDLQSTDSISFHNFHTSERECMTAAASCRTPTRKAPRESVSGWFQVGAACGCKSICKITITVPML